MEKPDYEKSHAKSYKQLVHNNQQKQQQLQRRLTEQTNKQKPLSKGSLLFNQMQMLTNKIKHIDNIQQQLINDNFQKSRQGSVASKRQFKRTQSRGELITAETIRKEREKDKQKCSMCLKKEYDIKEKQNSLKKLQKQLQSHQKQITYLNFQLDIFKQKQIKVASKSKEVVSSCKQIFKKYLQKFMSDVVLKSFSKVNAEITLTNKKIDILSSYCVNQSISYTRKQVDKVVQHGSIKTQGQSLAPASSAINLRKRSSSKPPSNRTQTLKIRQLDAKVKQKTTNIYQLQKQLVNVKKKNIEMISQYQTRLQNMRKLTIQRQSTSQILPPQITNPVKQTSQTSPQKQLPKLQQQYSIIQKKQQQLNQKMQNYRFKLLSLQKNKQKFQNMQKQIILQARQIQAVRLQLKQQKDANCSNVLIINRLKQKLQQIQFQLSLKQEQIAQTSQDLRSEDQKQKSNKISKQFKIFEDSNNKLKNQIKILNQSLHFKQSELEATHDKYRNQLYQKEKKLYELEMMIKQDFSKIRDFRESEVRTSRLSDTSLMFSTTRINISKQTDFMLSEGEIVLPEYPNIQQLFATKDFSKVQLDTQYDQQYFLRCVSEYIDNLRTKTSSIKSRSRSRNPSEQKLKDDKRSSELKSLVQNIIIQVNRINKQIPSIIKDQFFKLKNLLQKLKQQLYLVQSNSDVLNQLKDLNISFIRAYSKDKNSRQVEDVIKMIKTLLKISTI